jgi:hypothetical protein
MLQFSMHVDAICRVNSWRFGAIVLLALLPFTLAPSDAKAQRRLDEAPIDYLNTKGDNQVTQLIEKLESGEVLLKYEPGFGYLPSFLEALKIPVSSQVLVFSKTSLQMGRISPSNPRAVFFGDDVYVAWVRGSSLLEVSVADPYLGAVYYTFRMTPDRPSIRRENNQCLACHDTTTREGKVPVHVVRSVMTRSDGNINSLLKNFETDHTSPIKDRWGGWYVTGDAGEMSHMGNAFLEGEKLVAHRSDGTTDLNSYFDTDRWLSPSSDIVALMVLEHQAEMQNRLTRANYGVRRALYVAKQDATEIGDDLAAAIDESAKLVVDYLLFSGEAKLDSKIACSNSFTTDFSARGPRTPDGRSLRDFDLTKRLFRYPCSYLVYSSVFDSLEPALLDQVYRRLWRVLTDEDQSESYAHLTKEDRSSILKILRETKSGLPKYWLR